MITQASFHQDSKLERKYFRNCTNSSLIRISRLLKMINSSTLLQIMTILLLIVNSSSSFVPTQNKLKNAYPKTVVATKTTQYSSASQTRHKSVLDSFIYDVKLQYQQRIAADPQFNVKSLTEIVLAAGTQLTAEISRRGIHRIVPECDFVIAGILTAIVGKYYSMWKVAPSTSVVTAESRVVESMDDKRGSWNYFWSNQVPTNALQPYLLDGVTRPSVIQRCAALVAPMPSLFQAGFVASFIGYGFTALLIQIRSWFYPSYIAATVPINIFHACLYTGFFLASVSNIRYQVLQGFIEPRIIDRIFHNRYPIVRAIVIFTVRLANGLLGATLAIMGMKALKLQRIK